MTTEPEAIESKPFVNVRGNLEVVSVPATGRGGVFALRGARPRRRAESAMRARGAAHDAPECGVIPGMRLRNLLALGAIAATALGAAATGAPALAAPLGFSPPVVVDKNLAGGEPFVTADPVHGTLVYTSHEGTTHLYQPGLATSSVLTPGLIAVIAAAIHSLALA